MLAKAAAVPGAAKQKSANGVYLKAIAVKDKCVLPEKIRASDLAPENESRSNVSMGVPGPMERGNSDEH